MTGDDVREVFEEVLPQDLIERWSKQIGVVQRERKLEIAALARAMVIAAGTPSGAVLADGLRGYGEYATESVQRSAFYRWFDQEMEQLMEQLSLRALRYAKNQEVDLPGILGGVEDWIIVDSTTCRLPDTFIDEYPGTGDYSALKVHKHLSVGCGSPVAYHFSPARDHDSKHLEIDESWRGKGLLIDLAYASLDRLRDCVDHGVSVVIRLKEGWKPKVQRIVRGEVWATFFKGSDLDVVVGEETLILEGKAVDLDVTVGSGRRALSMRLVAVSTEKGYCWYLTNLPRRLGPIQVSQLYRVRWEVELSMRLDKSVHRLDQSGGQSTENVHALRTLLHAALISSVIASLLAHRHNLAVARATKGRQRQEAPVHVRLLALQMAVSSQRIALAFELSGDEASRAWDRIAGVLTHNGKDPNWRRRPSVLDELRGWKRQPKKRRKATSHGEPPK
jgi:hypothetical protein